MEPSDTVRQLLANDSMKNTLDLIGRIKNINVPNKFLCSLDIKSLFTNVAPEETVKCTCKFIHSFGIQLPIPTEYVDDFIILCNKNFKSFFLVDSYTQIDGTAMRSPVNPLLSDVFTSNLERTLGDSTQTARLYGQYVCDILMITNDKRQVEDIYNKFSTVHPNIL